LGRIGAIRCVVDIVPGSVISNDFRAISLLTA
jgi:hypothetical protein